MRTSILIASYVVASAIANGKITFSVTEFFVFMGIFIVMDVLELYTKLKK